jgi:hypothetical protein
MRSLVLALALTALTPALALAKQHRFAGMHPVHKEQGGGYCYIEGPHVHVYAPQHAEIQYRPEGDWNRFVGDPVAYGYDGPRFVFHGAHPVSVGPVTHYCYLRGDHFHEYQPEPSPEFQVKAGVHFYVGEFPKPFYEARPRLAKINVVYQPIRYARPTIVVEPPPEYVDVLYVEAAPPPPARAVYVAPAPVRAEAHFGVGVHVDLPPPPSLEVRIGGPSVVVEERTVIHEVHYKHKHKKHHGKHRGHWKRGWR